MAFSLDSRLGQVPAGVAALTPGAVLLVRHAVALRRSEWTDDDMARPLGERGTHQAAGLVTLLAGFPIARILSSPARRCIQTVAALAEARGLPVETTDALVEGDGREAVRLVHELADAGGVVMCSHGDVIPEVLESLGAVAPRCQKGSTWVLTRRAGDRALVVDSYLPPTA